jgi:hypothetical protein
MRGRISKRERKPRNSESNDVWVIYESIARLDVRLTRCPCKANQRRALALDNHTHRPSMQGLRFMEYVPSKDNDHANHTCRDLKCVQPSVHVHPGDYCIAEETSSIVNCSPNCCSICRESGTRLNRMHEADGAPPRFFERQAIPYLRWIESNRSDRGERSDPGAQIGGLICQGTLLKAT